MANIACDSVNFIRHLSLIVPWKQGKIEYTEFVAGCLPVASELFAVSLQAAFQVGRAQSTHGVMHADRSGGLCATSGEPSDIHATLAHSAKRVPRI